MEKCHQCARLDKTSIHVSHFYEREYGFCSSRCLLEFALNEYLSHSDNQLRQARKDLHDLDVAIKTVLPAEHTATSGIATRIKAVKSALYLIDRQR